MVISDRRGIQEFNKSLLRQILHAEWVDKITSFANGELKIGIVSKLLYETLFGWRAHFLVNTREQCTFHSCTPHSSVIKLLV